MSAQCARSVLCHPLPLDPRILEVGVWIRSDNGFFKGYFHFLFLLIFKIFEFQTSYLSRHFENMNENLNIGPPVYFVVEGDVKWYDHKVQVGIRIFLILK